nr:hypothetical protein [Tanacetum cinerariifolium]
DEDGEEANVHMYRSMIGSLMYLTSLRPDIIFAVCACARYQVNLKVSYLHDVKRIFRASLDRKSTIGGYQFLGCRLISWQYKKQTVVANFTTEDEYNRVGKRQRKRAGTELEQEIIKKQKVDDDKEKKIHKEGKKRYYQIVKADRKSQMYMKFSQNFKSFDMEDLKDLYKLVKARYGSARPVDSTDYLLWSNMKTMFEPHVEDESMNIYMLVEKKYPLTPPTLLMMLEKKLQIDYETGVNAASEL